MTELDTKPGLPQPPLTPGLMEEKGEPSRFRREERKEGGKTEENKSKIEVRLRREKEIFGRICGEWERKN